MTSTNYIRRIFLATALLAICAVPAAAQFVITTPDLPDGTVGQPYSASLQSVGGVPPINYSIVVGAGSLPPGITLSAGGVFSGSPTSGGFYNFIVQAVDSPAATVPQVTTKAFSIYVASVITIAPPSLPAVPANAPLSIQLSASGGSAPYFWEFDFQFPQQPPAWLSLSQTGLLTGTPPAQGSYTFGVMVWDQSESWAQKVYTLNVNPPVTITTAALPQGTAGQMYSTNLAATGGVPPYTFSLIGGTLPAGITLNASGLISGTPGAPSFSSLTFRATDSQGQFGNKVFTLDIQPAALSFTPTTLPAGEVNKVYSQTFMASGVGTSFSFGLVSGSLPPGLSLSQAGVISGTPSSDGIFTFVVELTSLQSSVSQAVTITIQAPTISILPESLVYATVGVPYTATLQATGGTAPYTFALSAGAMPDGLSLTQGGTISGTPTAAGTNSLTFTATDSSGYSGSKQYSLVVLMPLNLTPASLAPGKLNIPYSATLQPSGGMSPYSFSVSGSLPPGVSFNNGVISGTPTQLGMFKFTVTLTDSIGGSIIRNYQIAIPSEIKIDTMGPLPGGTVGTPYTTTIVSSAGLPPVTWSSAGNVPPGLSLNSFTGVLSGTPTKAGQYTFDVTVSDPTEASATRTFQITVVLPPLPPVTYTQVGTSAQPAQQPKFGLHLGQAYPVTINGTVNLTFAADRGADDAAVQFSNGARSMPFTIPAGQLDADFGSILAALQTGTVAGTITLTASISADQQDLTPSPAPQHTIRIASIAPVISKLELNRVSGGFELIVTGYSTPRQVTSAIVKFTPASGSSLATSDFTISVENLFLTYYSGAASAPYGSQFRLVIPFFVPQGLTGIASASVTLTNPIGTSAATSVTF